MASTIAAPIRHRAKYPAGYPTSNTGSFQRSAGCVSRCVHLINQPRHPYGLMTRHRPKRVFPRYEGTPHPKAFPGRSEASPKMAYTRDFRHKCIQRENIAGAGVNT
jgi:hypothetical protein